MQPLVSIVTVSLNAADTIEETLASVSLQITDFPVEHVCVDGGSTDSTRAIIDRWAELNVSITRIYEPDRGIFDAMNKGLAATKGEYVLFLNADDFLVTRDALRRAMTGCRIGSSENPDLIVGDAAMGTPGRIGFWRHRRVPRLLAQRRWLGLYPVHQGQFSKRTLLKAAGGFNDSLRIAADINQYYDIERRFKPSIRVLHADISFMHAGGTANRNIPAMYLGTREIYAHLKPQVGVIKTIVAVLIKTFQSLSELRFGLCHYDLWFHNCG